MARFLRIDTVGKASDAIEAQLGDFADNELCSFAVADSPLPPAFEEYD